MSISINGAIKAESHFRQKVEAGLTVLEYWGSESIAYLGEQAAAKLKEKFQANL